MAPCSQMADCCLGSIGAAVGFLKGDGAPDEAFDRAFQTWASKSQGILSSGGDLQQSVELLEKEFPNMAVAEGPGQPELPPEVQERRQLLQAVTDAGFGPSGAGGMALLWRNALKKNPALSTEYKELGRSFEKQRAFRKRWAATELKKLEEQWVHTEEDIAEDGTDGIYYPLARIWKEEGKDPSGALAAVNYVTACVRFEAEGKRLKGRPFVLFNKMTQRNEFLYLTRPCRDRLKDVRTHRRTLGQQAGRVAQTRCCLPPASRSKWFLIFRVHSSSFILDLSSPIVHLSPFSLIVHRASSFHLSSFTLHR